jgi:hypothetical protein
MPFAFPFKLICVTLRLADRYLPKAELSLRKAMEPPEVPAQWRCEVIVEFGVELRLELNGDFYRLGQHLLVTHIRVHLAVVARFLSDKRRVFPDKPGLRERIVSFLILDIADTS